MNIPLLRQIQEKILTLPELFDMNYFEHKNECGTTFCISGWAEKLSGIESEEGVDPGAVALGIDDRESFRLFYYSEWPSQFQGEDGDDWTPTPQQAVDRIEHFIATEGRE